MSTPSLPRLERAGLDGWIVRLFDTIDERNLPWLTALGHDCHMAFGATLIDLVPSYTTLLVVFDPQHITPSAARQKLARLLTTLQPQDTDAQGCLHEVPTCYDSHAGPDLARVAALSNLSVNEVIACHMARTYRVFALGTDGESFEPLAQVVALVRQRLLKRGDVGPVKADEPPDRVAAVVPGVVVVAAVGVADVVAQHPDRGHYVAGRGRGD